MCEKIAQKAAEIIAGKDWHKLSNREHQLLEMLENEGYIIPNKPADGFVGKAAHLTRS